MKFSYYIITALLTSSLSLLSCKEDNKDNKDKEPQITKKANHLYQETEQKRSTKRGVAFNYTIEQDVEHLAPSCGWVYNWGNSMSEKFDNYLAEYDVEYVPMAWNGNYSVQNMAKWIDNHDNTKYLLGFNEPNLTDQANMIPSKAAELWPKLEDAAEQLGLDLISPAMNYGTLAGYSDPIKWLDEFYNLVDISTTKAIAIHCYMNSGGAVKSYIDRFKKYNLPIWMTEFCAWDGGVGSVENQMDYMCDVVTYMELCPEVERYAWFIPRTSSAVNSEPYMQLLEHTKPFNLTPLGILFTNMPTFDKNFYQAAELEWNMNLFSNCATSECVGKDGFIKAPHFRISTDKDEPSESGIMLHEFGKGNWIEYQVEALETLYTFEVRCNHYGTTVIEVQVDDEPAVEIQLEKTNGQWETQEFEVDITPGCHTVRITGTKSTTSISWVKFSK